MRLPFRSSIALLVALLTGLFALPRDAAAKTCVIESRASDIDPLLLAELAKRGEIALIETNDRGGAKQVVMFSVLEAPPDKVWDALMDVEAYPKFLKTVVSTKITKKERGGAQLAFDWELDVPFFNLKGSRAQRGIKPTLVEVRGVSGQLRGTRERWELYPLDDGKRTLAAFYRALDVDTGGMLLETMIKLEPSMEQGATLATGFVHMRGVKRYVEGKPMETSIPAQTGPVPPFDTIALGQGGLALNKLNRFLRHGQLALISSHADGSLQQIAIFAIVNATKEKIAAVVKDPGKYPEFIPNFARQSATPLAENQLELDWELEVPMTNLEGHSIMTFEPDGSVDVLAKTGDITRGRWRWEFTSIDAEKTIPVHYAYSDVRESSWVTRKLVEKEPLFEHGIVIASGTIAMTAMKARAEGKR